MDKAKKVCESLPNNQSTNWGRRLGWYEEASRDGHTNSRWQENEEHCNPQGVTGYEFSNSEGENEEFYGGGIFFMVGGPIKKRRFMVSRLQSLINTSWSGFAKAVVNPIFKDHFSFQFHSQDEIDRVWHRGPWIFDGVLMGLRQVRKDQAFATVKLDRLSFWVQLHNLPLQS